VSAPGDPSVATELADFEAFVRTHQARVRQQLRRLIGTDTALADDLAQDAFVQAWRHRTQFRGQALPSTWLHRIAYNLYVSHVRRAPLAAALVDELVNDAALQALPAAADDTALRLDMARALARLPEPERVALVHCFVLDLSHSEAAEVLGWPLGTLKSHVARGKARLAEHLAAWATPGATVKETPS
jgi:RNA polymerase sigma factor (sigma-70 family)